MFFKKPWIEVAKTIRLENEVIELRPLRFFEDYYNGAKIQNYTYQILRQPDKKHVGYCDLRVGDEVALYYLGNIGYNIFFNHQRQGYATQATILLIDLAKQIEMEKLSITCNTDNIPSLKIIEKTGFTRIASVAVPADEPLFQQGDYFKFIYTMDLKGES